MTGTIGKTVDTQLALAKSYANRIHELDRAESEWRMLNNAKTFHALEIAQEDFEALKATTMSRIAAEIAKLHAGLADLFKLA